MARRQGLSQEQVRALLFPNEDDEVEDSNDLLDPLDENELAYLWAAEIESDLDEDIPPPPKQRRQEKFDTKVRVNIFH